MSIYLYVKTHQKTGLKYLGKTVQDPHTYPGSGIRWKNHIRKHGNDVITEVIETCKTSEELRERGLYYSNLWNIVESSDWANCKEETGDGGDTSQTPEWEAGMKKRPSTKGKTYEEIYGAEAAARLRQQRANAIRKHRKGKTLEEIFNKDTAEKMRNASSERLSAYNKTRVFSEETRKKIGDGQRGRKQPRCSCITCGKEVSINNLTSHQRSCQS